MHGGNNGAESGQSYLTISPATPAEQQARAVTAHARRMAYHHAKVEQLKRDEQQPRTISDLHAPKLAPAQNALCKLDANAACFEEQAQSQQAVCAETRRLKVASYSILQAESRQLFKRRMQRQLDYQERMESHQNLKQIKKQLVVVRSAITTLKEAAKRLGRPAVSESQPPPCHVISWKLMMDYTRC